MTTATASRGRGGPISIRFRLLQIGLFLPVLVTLVLCGAYLRALSSRQRAIEAAGQQIARRVADQSLVEASRRGDSAAHAILDPAATARPSTPGKILEAMQRAADSLRVCGCGPRKEGAYFLVWVPSTGELVTSHPLPAGLDPHRRLPSVSSIIRGGQVPRVWALTGRDSTGQWLLHFATVRLVDGTEAVAGFDISMASWWSGTFAPAIAQTRRQFFPMLADPDSAFSAQLMASGRAVGRTPERYAGQAARAPILGGEVFSLEVSLNPAVLPVLVSAAVPPSYPLLLGALGASVLLSALALLLLRQLREMMARRDAFIASISHELRTPLTEVLLHGESLQLDRQTPDSKQRAAGAIVRETRRLIGLVENALTLAGAGRSRRPAGEAIRPAEVLRSTLQALEPALASRRAVLELELDESVGCAIDPVSLDRIATNLVENALRYGPVGQTIAVRLRGGIGSVQLIVGDQGPGVPAAERSRIWEAFERGSAARTAGSTGVGLGLAIVKELTEAAGGRVTVTNGPGGGAEFVVILPAARLVEAVVAG